MENSEVAGDAAGVPGRWVVIAMFVFGLSATGFLWTYSKLHYAPFVPLQRALVAEFSRKAMPRVEGGRHRGGPMILRVVMTVDFDPNSELEGIPERVRQMESRIIELARQHQDLSKYEDLEIYLVHRISDSELQRHEFKHKIAGLAAADRADSPAKSE
jgi:hypothetical protein